MITQLAPNVYTGLFSQLPNPNGYRNGDIYYASDTNVLFVLLIINATNRIWSAASVPFSTPVQLFVDPVNGNNSNSGFSAASALQTLTAALQRLQRGWTSTATITLLAGTYNLGTNPYLTVPAPAPGGSPLLIQGTMVEPAGATGTRTPSGGTAGTFNPPAASTWQDSVGGFGVNAYKGTTLRSLATDPIGALRFMIVSNTANTFTTVPAIAAGAPVAADQYVVEDWASHIVWTGDAVFCLEGALSIDSIHFQVDSSLRWLGIGPLQGTGIKYDSIILTGSILSHGLSVSYPAFSSRQVLKLPAGVTLGGIYATATPSSFSIGGATVEFTDRRTQISGSFLNGVDVTAVNYADMYILDVTEWDSGGGLADDASITLLRVIMNASVPNQNGDGTSTIQVSDSGFLNAQLLVQNGALGGAGVALVLVSNSRAFISSWTGTNPAAGVPLVAAQGASVVVSADTVTGAAAGNDVTVGANAVTSWANINGGTTARVSDIGAVSTQLCRVGP